MQKIELLSDKHRPDVMGKLNEENDSEEQEKIQREMKCVQITMGLISQINLISY